MSQDCRDWLFKMKQSSASLSSYDIGPYLAHLLIIASHFNEGSEDIYQLIEKCCSRALPNIKDNLIQSIWHELTSYFSVRNYFAKLETFKIMERLNGFRKI